MKKNYFLSWEFCLLILFIFFSYTVPAQSVETKFDKINIAIPNCILQDRNGFIWIGSQEGLIRYDGYKLKKYQSIPFDSTSISANWVISIVEDQHGNLWVGTADGLNYFDQITEEFRQIKLTDKDDPALTSKSIPKMILDDDGSMWIATTDCGVFFTNSTDEGRTKFTHFDLAVRGNMKNSGEKLQVWDLYLDNENFLWIGTANSGLFKLDIETKEITQYINDPNDPTSISHNSVRLICPDNSGNLWIGTSSEEKSS